MVDWLKQRDLTGQVAQSSGRAWRMDETSRDGLTRQQFARYYLMRLGIEHDLTRIALDPKHPRKIASEAEVLALRPELLQIE